MQKMKNMWLEVRSSINFAADQNFFYIISFAYTSELIKIELEENQK
jgi:hypothetical protein